MNFKKVRHKIVVSGILGVLFIGGQGIQSDAAETSIATTTTEERSKLAVYGETFGQESFAILTDTDYVYIRSDSSEDSDWVGKLYPDNKVTILSIELFAEGEWAQIESGTVTGYVELEYLMDADETATKDAELSERIGVVTASALNVREGGGMEYEVIDLLSQDDEVIIWGESEDWYLVYYEDVIGYVYSEYVIEETQYTYAESKEEEEIRLAEENSISYGEEVVEYAMQFLGNPYVWGGTDLVNGADCSGFVQSVYKYFGIDLPRTSAQQRTAGIEVSYDEIMIGDIICYDGHVGIYIGDDLIINAIGSDYGIGISSATYSEIITIRRVL